MLGRLLRIASNWRRRLGVDYYRVFKVTRYFRIILIIHQVRLVKATRIEIKRVRVSQEERTVVTLWMCVRSTVDVCGDVTLIVNGWLICSPRSRG